MSAGYSAVRESARRGRVRPADYEAYTPLQRRWCWTTSGSALARIFLLRAANQLGKSRAQARKLMHFVRATGPYKDRRPGPVRVLVISISKEQMEPLHQKIWELLPKEEIDDEVDFVPGFGFRGKPPKVNFVSGPGKGSTIVFATYAQGSKRIAGGTYDVVLCDEPLPERLFGEARARILHGRPGEMWISMTLTPDSPDVDYLRKKVAAGEVFEIQASLTLENVTLETGRTLITQKDIDDFTGSLLEIEKDMRLHGGWDIVVTERLLTNFDTIHIRPTEPAPGSILAIGIDHGAGAGKQAAALLAIEQAQGLTPHIHILEEYVADGYTTPEQDARAILQMLANRGWGYDHVDVWVGDRSTNLNRYDIRKSNRELSLQMAAILQRRPRELKRIETPRKWGGSVTYGYRMMNAVMGRRDEFGLPHFIVDPKCTAFIDAARRWRGNPRDNLKDVLDATRYPLEKVVQPGGWFSFRAVYA